MEKRRKRVSSTDAPLMASSSSSALVSALFAFSLILAVSRATLDTELKGIDLEHPVLEFSPSRLPQGNTPTPGSKDVLSCERVRVSGLSRLKLGSYASSFRVTLAPSVLIPEKMHSRVQVCFHRNATLGLCQCEKDEWKGIQKGIWQSAMSPYDKRYIDVKFIGEVSGSATVSVEEDSQHWRLLCLGLGLVLLFLAPIVSHWVPFYYSSSMAVGVLLVILLILFQGMKLLPTGRKNVFYLTIYGSVLGAGSFLLHHFSMMINSILVNFGLDEEMHNPVSIFALVGIVLAGAGLGYWMVRKFVISEDGSVDIGVAQFVKWAMRVIAVTLILQSSVDTPLAFGAVISCWAICSLITSSKWRRSKSPTLWRRKQAVGKHRQAEFLSRSANGSPQGKIWGTQKKSYALSESPAKGLTSRSGGKWTNNRLDFYSTFHKTPYKKKLSKKEWDDFTQESTRSAMSELASSPQFTEWIIENADRIKLLPSDGLDATMGSGSDSTEETALESTSRRNNIFPW